MSSSRAVDRRLERIVGWEKFNRREDEETMCSDIVVWRVSRDAVDLVVDLVDGSAAAAADFSPMSDWGRRANMSSSSSSSSSFPISCCLSASFTGSNPSNFVPFFLEGVGTLRFAGFFTPARWDHVSLLEALALFPGLEPVTVSCVDILLGPRPALLLGVSSFVCSASTVTRMREPVTSFVSSRNDLEGEAAYAGGVAFLVSGLLLLPLRALSGLTGDESRERGSIDEAEVESSIV